MTLFNIVISLAALIILLYSILYTFNYLKKSKGRAGEKKTFFILNLIAKKRGGKLLTSVYLPLYRTLTEIDAIYIDKRGIVVCEIKNISGTLSGNISDRELIHVCKNKTHKMYNPGFQNSAHCANVVHHLKKGGFNGVPVYSAVIMANQDIRLALNGKQGKTGGFLLIEQIPAAVSRLPLPRKNADVNSIYRYLKSVRSKNPFKKLIHDLKPSFKGYNNV